MRKFLAKQKYWLKIMLVQTVRLRQRKIKLFYEKIDFLQVRKPVSGLAQKLGRCIACQTTIQYKQANTKTRRNPNITSQS
jgi:hypothetical protein